MEKIEMNGYSLENNFIMLTSSGMQAFMRLASLLWQDKTKVDKNIVEYDIHKNTVIVLTKKYKYVFKNVPIQWDGNLDIYSVYANHIQDLKKSEVI